MGFAKIAAASLKRAEAAGFFDPEKRAAFKAKYPAFAAMLGKRKPRGMLGRLFAKVAWMKYQNFTPEKKQQIADNVQQRANLRREERQRSGYGGMV